jgi:hypothetical protein
MCSCAHVLCRLFVALDVPHLLRATTQVRSCTGACRTSSFLTPFSACIPVSFCAACSLVPVLRPHTRSIRASLPLADRSSRDVPLLSPRLARVSVLVSAFRARDRVVSLLAYSVIHALSHTALSLTALSPTALSHTALSHTALSLTAFSHTALSHTALSHTALSHTALSHTSLSHTALSLMPSH